MKFKSYSFVFAFVLLFVIFSCQMKSDTESPSITAITVDNAISADGVTISYQVQGEGKPALIFVHGWCCDRSYWDAQLPHFAKKYKVVAIDLAGHGESGLERKDWTIKAYGEDVAAVVNKLNFKQVILIGHSMGGYVILEAARIIPEKVIGLVGADTLNDFEFKFTQEQIDEWFKPFHANFAEATKNLVRTMFTPNSDPALMEKIAADMSSAPPEVGLGAFEGMISFHNNDYLKVVQEVQAPLTCINSDMDPTNVEVNRRYMPSFKAKIMSGIGHFLMMEDPETFNRLLEETLQEFVQTAKSK